MDDIKAGETPALPVGGMPALQAGETPAIPVGKATAR